MKAGHTGHRHSSRSCPINRSDRAKVERSGGNLFRFGKLRFSRRIVAPLTPRARSGHSSTGNERFAVKTPQLLNRPDAVRRFLQCLSLVLIPGLAVEDSFAGPRFRDPSRYTDDRRDGDPPPYLTAIGPPGMRFREPDPAAEPVARPVAIGPPIAGLNAVEVTVALANAAAARETLATVASPARPIATASEPKTGSPVASTLPSTGATTAASAVAPADESASRGSAQPVPPAIMVDENRPRVRAEDFLPFFVLPGATGQPGGVNFILPLPGGTSAAPAPIPASSATYTHSPK